MERPATPVFGEPGQLSYAELRLAARNHGMPLEALGYPITPTGLHYLLTHYDVPAVDAGSWGIDVGGAVDRPLRLSLSDLHARPSTRIVVTMECAGNGRALLEPRPLSQPWLHEAVGTAEWEGVPLAALLDEVGVVGDATEVVFSALDRGVENGVEQVYERSITLEEARRPEVLIALEMNGAPLLPQHGAPARLVVPGWYGMTNVKWLSAIRVVRESFTGPQQSWSYRMRQDPSEAGVPLSRILPHALMQPPGIPDFFTRDRVVDVGPCRLTGRAWSGGAPIDGVEVSVDGEATWAAATLGGADLGPWAWRSWSYDWNPSQPGPHVLACRARATDAPERPDWNLGGYANPAPQRVNVMVRGMIFDLDRFVVAQKTVYDGVVAELRAGRKTGHWMWFIFPQLAELGRSEMSRYYGIVSIGEARAYLANPVLGPRLRECAGLMLTASKPKATDILGTIDGVKLRSSMTLFYRAAPHDVVFAKVLDRFFDGVADPQTDELLAG